MGGEQREGQTLQPGHLGGFTRKLQLHTGPFASHRDGGVQVGGPMCSAVRCLGKTLACQSHLEQRYLAGELEPLPVANS